MKNKITCLLAGAALFGATANADIAIGEGLTAYGYIDQVVTDLEGGDNREGSLGEYEIGLSFTPAESQFSAVAELSYDDATSGAEFETVAVTYQYSDALSFSAGNIYTYMGLESADAPNNSFISFAGSSSDTVSPNGDGFLYGATWGGGVAADYSAGDITLGVWSQVSNSPDLEYYAAYSGIENLTLSVALAENDGGDDVTNLMAVYELGDFTISAEDVDVDNTLDVTSVSVAYGMGDTTIAVRSVDGDYTGTDYDKFSIAVFRALSDQVAVGVEYSDEDLDGVLEAKGIGVELLYVF